MKKIICLLLVLLAVSGCANKGYSRVTDGDAIIFKGPNKTYTKNDLYKQLKLSSQSQITEDILNEIAVGLNIDMSEIESEADSMIEMYMEAGYEDVIISYYGSVEAYRQQYISSLVLNKLASYYVDVKFDEFVANDKPIKMQMVSFYDMETAEKFVKDVNGGKDFATAAKDNEYLYDCPVQIYLDTYEYIPLEVKKYINETSVVGLSSIIECTSSATDADGNLTENKTYYVLNIVNRDVKKFKDEYLETKASDIEQTEVIEYLFSNHEIKFYDQDIYEIMKSTYEVLQ